MKSEGKSHTHTHTWLISAVFIFIKINLIDSWLLLHIMWHHKQGAANLIKTNYVCCHCANCAFHCGYWKLLKPISTTCHKACTACTYVVAGATCRKSKTHNNNSRNCAMCIRGKMWITILHLRKYPCGWWDSFSVCLCVCVWMNAPKNIILNERPKSSLNMIAEP